VSRRLILVFHRYAGLGLAAFLALLGTSGAILPWEEELDAALNPVLLGNEPAGPALSPLAIRNAFRTEYPDAEPGLVILPRDPRRTAIVYVIRWPDDYGRRVGQVFVNRYSGEIAGTRDNLPATPFGRSELVP